MAKYGNTWWGQQWLNALNNIGYANRLPRGRTYANNGSVQDIQFQSNLVKAKVKGRRRSPYKIELSLPAFSSKQIDNLVRIITGNPHLLSRLLKRELPDELNDLARKNGVQIFPDSQRDLEMNCSCPDWAVPCKHIAAVIYIIANEIDRNPFIVFHLHGLDILKQIEQHGFASDSKDTAIPKAEDDYVHGDDFNHHHEPIVEDELATSNRSLDLSVIPDLQEQLLSLLDDQQLFYSKNFKPVLKRGYKAVANAIAKRLQLLVDEAQQESVSNFGVDYERFHTVELVLNNEVFYFDTILIADDGERHFSRREGMPNLVAYLDKIPAKYADRLSLPLLALYQTYHYSLTLLRQSAYLPQILQLTNGDYTIRWIPALMNETVEALHSRLTATTPPKLVQINDASYEPKYLNARNQVVVLSSLFLDYFVDQEFGQTLRPVNRYRPDTNDIIDQFFFTYHIQPFDQLGQKEIPGTIHQWLSSYYLTHRDYVPLLKVEEDEGNYFEIQAWVENRKEALQEPVTLHAFLTKDDYKAHKIGVLQSLSELMRHFPDLESLLASAGKTELLYNATDFVDVLLKILPAVKLLGINILLPNALKQWVRPQTSLSLATSAPGQTVKGYLDLEQMLSFKWQVALGDETLSVEEFSRLVKGMSGIVKIKNQYVLVDQNEINKLLNSLTKEASLDAGDLLKAALTEEYQSARIAISEQAKKIIADLLKTDDVALPDDLQADLRPYQERGYEWLYRNARAGFGSIIADDMGLGKTLQVITTILRLKAENQLKNNKGLIVVPTTLLTNWAKEIEKFAPSLQYQIYHGTGRELELSEPDVIITTYGVLRSDINSMQRKRWAIVVLDEAQNIKNPGTEQTKAVKKLKAPVKIAMSGTPVENRLSEYWSIFDFTNKGYLGSLKYFKDEFATPIEAYRDEHKLAKFKQITTPFILRRLKTDKNIISDLPEKVETDTYVSLTKAQAGLYQNTVDTMMKAIEVVNGEGDIKRQGLIFKLMTALKQICNHPNQFLKKEEYNGSCPARLCACSICWRIFTKAMRRP